MEPLGIVTLYEQNLPVRPPPEYAVTAADKVKMAQSARFGSTHLAAFVLCIAVDDALRPDPGEIAEARWLPPREFEAGAPEHWAGMVATLRESGTLAAAARLATLRGTTPAPPPEVTAAAEAAARAGLMLGYSLSLRHARYSSSFEARVFNALPPPTAAAAFRAVPTVNAVRPLTLTTASAITPPPSPDEALAIPPAVAGAAGVFAGLALAAAVAALWQRRWR